MVGRAGLKQRNSVISLDGKSGTQRSTKDRAKSAQKSHSIPLISSARFWSGVNRNGGHSACWPWQGARSGAGYGRIKIEGRLYSPHRVAYVLTHGPIEPDDTYHGPVVMHTCDNPVCCNPAHLRLGTMADNAQDMAAKGRHWSQVSPAPRKISTETIDAILADHRSSREVAAQLGLGDRYVRKIRSEETRRRRWRVPDPSPISLPPLASASAGCGR